MLGCDSAKRDAEYYACTDRIGCQPGYTCDVPSSRCVPVLPNQDGATRPGDAVVTGGADGTVALDASQAFPDQGRAVDAGSAAPDARAIADALPISPFVCDARSIADALNHASACACAEREMLCTTVLEHRC